MCAFIAFLSACGFKNMHLPNKPAKMESNPRLIIDPLVNGDEIFECGIKSSGR